MKQIVRDHGLVVTQGRCSCLFLRHTKYIYRIIPPIFPQNPCVASGEQDLTGGDDSGGAMGLQSPRRSSGQGIASLFLTYQS